MARQTQVHVFAIAAALAIALVAPVGMADSSTKGVNVDSAGVAIKGYDTVAYFTNGRAIKGDPEFVFDWNSAQWRFASAAHRDMFSANPERYAPRFGGHCSMGLTKGRLVSADPEAWTIIDGKLYLYFSKEGREKFRQNTPENIRKAEANWDKARKSH